MSSSRRLRTFVSFHGDHNVTLGPDDELPGWAVDFLDNAAKDAGLDVHPAYAVEEPAQPEAQDDAEAKPRSAPKKRHR